jgi:ATP-dependent Clp protease ATP-binding subunit ClpC
MSEYMEKHSVSKMVGSPPGYVGFDEGGQLTEKIRRKPYSVVLFDEIEKAHPDVFNMLLQILEDGILSDSQGRQVSFKNTILIMTSNVGSSTLEFSKRVGFTVGENEQQQFAMNEHAMKELKKVFRPEFLNRIDEIIPFNQLTREDVETITVRFLDQLAERVKNLHIDIRFDTSVVDLIVQRGFDPTNGARNIRRTVTREIEDRLSEAMLTQEISSGMSIRMFVIDGNVKIEKM